MSKIYVDEIAGIASPSTVAIPGHVIQVKHNSSSTQVTNATDTWTDMGLSVSITPSSATNYLYVLVEGHWHSQNSSTGKGYGFNIYKDGVAVTSSPNDGVNRPYDFYQDGASRFFDRNSKIYYDVSGTTNEVIFTAKFKGYNYGTHGEVVLNYDNETKHSLTVMEIAG